MARDNTLFSDTDLPSTLENLKQKALKDVKTLDERTFSITAEDSLVDEICARHRLNPLVVHENRLSCDEPKERAIDVTGNWLYASRDDGQRTFAPGYELKFFLPFEGDPDLFEFRGSSWSTSAPSAEVDSMNKRLVFRAEVLPSADAEGLKRKLLDAVKSVCSTVAGQARLIDRYHAELPTLVRAEIHARRKRLEQMQGFSLKIGIPLERDVRVPSQIPVAVKKRAEIDLVRKVSVPGTVVPVRPEPCIADTAYEEILGITRHAGLSFEKTPQTYKGLGEEGLRDIMLSHLNVAFPGKASAETFVQFGKTDICVMSEERRAFVAECKMWHGEKGLVDALCQLFDYLTWRESKAALIFFNKDNAGFTQLQATFAEALRNHPQWLREKPADSGEWRHVFRHPDDPLREITVHAMLFNMFVPQRRAGKHR